MGTYALHLLLVAAALIAVLAIRQERLHCEPSIWLQASPCELYSADRATTTSQRCLQCHDGSVGISVSNQSTPGIGASHAFGIDYLAAFARTGLNLQPPALLPPQLLLVDGKVECTTCHDGRAATRARLALPSSGSALCLACHVK